MSNSTSVKPPSHSTKIFVLESTWKSVCTMAGVAALISTLCSLVTLVVVSTLGGEPSTAQEYFSVLQDNRVVGLLRMDFASVINVSMYFLLFFGLYAALREGNPAYSALATAMIYVGVTLWLSSHSGMSMIHLSDRFAVAATGTERSQLLTIGEATIASDMWHTTGALVGGILMQTAAVLISLLMLSSTTFGKATAYIGVLAHGLDLIHILIGIFVPAIGNVLMFVAGTLYLIWFPLVGQKLFQIGRRGNWKK